MTATKMVLNPVVCHDTVAALHEVCDGRPDVLMSDQAASETLVCFLCRGLVSYKDCNPSKLNK